MGRSGDLLEEDGSLRGCKPTIGSVLAFAREVSAIDFNNSGGKVASVTKNIAN